MPHIHVETDSLRDTGFRLIAESSSLAGVARVLRHAILSLDTGAWDGRSRWRAEPLLEQVRPRATRLADDLYHLGRLLLRVADQFESAENDALAGIGEHIDWDKTAQMLSQEVEG